MGRPIGPKKVHRYSEEFKATAVKLSHLPNFPRRPHGRPDAVEKATGLARYAERHGDYFGRIELIIVGKDGEIRRLNVKKEAIREKVLSVQERGHLEALFAGQA